jgi:hypothetical protein
VPPDAPVIVYVDVAAIRRMQHSLLSAVWELADPGSQTDRDYAEFVRATGFDYTRDLDKAAIALWLGGLEMPPRALGENHVLAVADGHFDEHRIEAYALRSGKVATHGTQTFYEVPGEPPVSLRFLSPSRIALSSGKNAEALLTESSQTVRDPVTQARIDRVAGAPVFGIARMDHLPNSFYASFANMPQLEKLTRSIRSLSLAGQPDGDRFQVTLDAECDSMKSALQISTLLDGFRIFGSLALSDPRTRRQMTKEQAAFLGALINQVKVSPQNHWVRLSLDITPEMLGASSPAPSRHPPTPR